MTRGAERLGVAVQTVSAAGARAGARARPCAAAARRPRPDADRGRLGGDARGRPHLRARPGTARPRARGGAGAADAAPGGGGQRRAAQAADLAAAAAGAGRAGSAPAHARAPDRRPAGRSGAAPARPRADRPAAADTSGAAAAHQRLGVSSVAWYARLPVEAVRQSFPRRSRRCRCCCRAAVDDAPGSTLVRARGCAPADRGRVRGQRAAEDLRRPRPGRVSCGRVGDEDLLGALWRVPHRRCPGSTSLSMRSRRPACRTRWWRGCSVRRRSSCTGPAAPDGAVSLAPAAP